MQSPTAVRFLTRTIKCAGIENSAATLYRERPKTLPYFVFSSYAGLGAASSRAAQLSSSRCSRRSVTVMMWRRQYLGFQRRPPDPQPSRPPDSSNEQPFSPLPASQPIVTESERHQSPVDNAGQNSPPSDGASQLPPIATTSQDKTSARLPSTSERDRFPLSARFSTIMDNMQSRALTATQTLNDLTGYTAIEQIKHQNLVLEQRLHAAQARLRTARHAYKARTQERAASQREVTALLARKDTWSPLDLERFTALYRTDHELEAGVAAASAELSEAETEESKLGAELNAGILKRYHEEQVWSDRIRRQSTWGTWGLMGVNILLFLGLQFVAEPWRRRRLLKGIVESERESLDEVRKELSAVRQAIVELEKIQQQEVLMPVPAQEKKDGLATRFIDKAPVPGRTGAISQMSLQPVLSEPQPVPWTREHLLKFSLESWRAYFSDLYSDRRIDFRMRDASLLALESAVAGIAAACLACLFVVRRS